MKDTHFYGHIREFAERKAMVARQDALAWDILAKDILKEKHRIEAEKRNKHASIFSFISSNWLRSGSLRLLVQIS